MKRIQIHVSVGDLAESICFYSALFGGIQPTVRENGYCKWELHDPEVNLSLSQHLVPSGVDHFGIQVDTDEELTEVCRRFEVAEKTRIVSIAVGSSYGSENRSSTVDPQGVAWKTFHVRDAAASFDRSRGD